MATRSTYYFDGLSFATAIALFTDQALTIKAADGYYSLGTISRRQVNGLLQAGVNCANCSDPLVLCYDATSVDDLCCTGCTPGANLTAFNSSIIGNFLGVCDIDPTEVYYHNGLGTYPAANDFVFTDSIGTTPLSNGWYHYISPSNKYRITNDTGYVADAISCESNLTAFSSSVFYTTSVGACSGVENQTYYHNGSGNDPVTSDVCYLSDGGSFLVDGYYKISSTQYIRITGGAGVVNNVGTFSLGTSFSASTTQTSGAFACATLIGQTYYHNGGSSLPVAANTCYTNQCKTIILSNGFYKISSNQYLEITGGAGIVSAVTTCPTVLNDYDSSQTATTSPNACFASLGTTYYHDGAAGANPAVNDTCYLDSAGVDTLPIGWYRANNIGGDIKYNVNDDGVVQSVILCV